MSETKKKEKDLGNGAESREKWGGRERRGSLHLADAVRAEASREESQDSEVCEKGPLRWSSPASHCTDGKPRPGKVTGLSRGLPSPASVSSHQLRLCILHITQQRVQYLVHIS